MAVRSESPRGLQGVSGAKGEPILEISPSDELSMMLVNTQTPKLEVRLAAEQQLAAAAENNFEIYILALATELATEGRPELSRQLAGIMLKNAISGKDTKLDVMKRQKWFTLDSRLAAVIRTKALTALQSSSEQISGSACQVVAKVGRFDLPQNKWPELIPALMSMLKTGLTVPSRTALTALGYLAEDIQLLVDEVGTGLVDDATSAEFVNITVQGMLSQDLYVSLAAAKAFYNVLPFADCYMRVPHERSQIVKVVTDALSSSDVRIQSAAWECALQLVNEYYTCLDTDFKVLRDLSFLHAKSPNKTLAIAAIEFWATICDEEILILLKDSDRQMKFYVQTNYEGLLSVIFDCMCNQEAEEEPDNWTPAMAAQACLGLCASVLRDHILQPAQMFIDRCFSDPDWRRREAAVFCYGSIMDGPDATRIWKLISNSFISICAGLDDPVPAVRDSTGWAIGRVAQFHLSAIYEHLGTLQRAGLLNALVNKLSDVPRVANQASYALYEIAANVNAVAETVKHVSAGQSGNSQINMGESPSKPITPIDMFFKLIAENLLILARRPDASEYGCRSSALNALYMLVSQANDEYVSDAIEVLLTETLQWLTLSLQHKPPTAEVLSVQESMCGCLYGLIVKLDKRVAPKANEVMTMLIQLLDVQNQMAEARGLPIQQSSVAEEALLAMNGVVNALGPDFRPYTQQALRFLIAGLKNKQDASYCKLCIECVGDLGICLAAEMDVSAIETLFELLKDPAAPIALKPKAMAALADIASVSMVFTPYRKAYLEFLDQAATAKINEGPMNSEEWINYMGELRDATLTAYPTIIYSFANDNRELAEFKSRVNAILEFVDLVVSDTHSTVSNIVNALRLVEDLVQLYQCELAAHLIGSQTYKDIKEKFAKSKDSQIATEMQTFDNTIAKFRVPV